MIWMLWTVTKTKSNRTIFDCNFYYLFYCLGAKKVFINWILFFFARGDKETTETSMCRNGEKDEMNVGEEQGNNRLTLCEQMESATVTESSQDENAITFINERSFGKRPIIPTQKMIEWQWTSFGGRRSGGRRGRGRQGRGGRGRGRESGSGSGSGNLN